MSKTNFSSAVSASLNGRNEVPTRTEAPVIKPAVPEPVKEPKKRAAKEKTEKPSNTDKKGKTDKGLGMNQDGTFRQSMAGRKTAEETQKPKRSQVALTLDAETIEKLSNLGDGYKKLLNRYIDKNIDEIVTELERL